MKNVKVPQGWTHVHVHSFQQSVQIQHFNVSPAEIKEASIHLSNQKMVARDPTCGSETLLG